MVAIPTRRPPSVPPIERVTVRALPGTAALAVSVLGADGRSGEAATLAEPGVPEAIGRLTEAWRHTDPLAAERRWRQWTDRTARTRAERLAFGAIELACADLVRTSLGIPLAALAGGSSAEAVASPSEVPPGALDADAFADPAAIARACFESDAAALVFSLPLAGGLPGLRRILALARAFNLQPVARLVTRTEIERRQLRELAAALGFAVAGTRSEGASVAAARPVRIRRIRLRRVKLPLAQVYVSAMYLTDHMLRTLVEVETDAGVVGLGETTGVDEVFRFAGKIAKTWIGADALDRRGLARRFARIAYENRNGRNGWHAVAGLELACWDLAGKVHGLSLARLLGAAEEASSVRAVCVVPSARLDRIVPRSELAAHFADLGNVRRVAESALAARERYGFSCFKYKSAGVGAAWDLAVMRGLREALGPGAELRFDPNASYGTADAAELCRALEPLALEYYEDPTDGIEGLARVKRRVTRPIASNMVVVQFDQIAPAARRGAVDVVLADVFHWGGLENYRDMAAACEALGNTCAIHSFYESGVATAANVHIALGLGLTVHANDQGYDGLADDVLAPGALTIQDGRIALPPGSGIGVALDEARMRRLTVDETIVE